MLPRPARLLLPVIASVLLNASCTEEVDRAARNRIFSPEDPPQVVASSKEALPVDKLDDDPALALRVLTMTGAEAIERLGAHAMQSTLVTEWSFGGNTRKQVETRKLVSAQGAVFGDFHATSQIDPDQGLEVMRVKNKVYAKSRYGRFRQRQRDRGMAERARDETYGALRDVAALFKNRVQLTPMGTVTHKGREAWRFKVSLAEAGPEIQAADLPPISQAKTGLDEGTRARNHFFESRKPLSLEGQVLVDSEAAVVLKAKLTGRLTAPPPEGVKGGKADIRISLDSEVTSIGKDPRLTPPADFLADADKPQGIADALDRFGMPRAGRDGGTDVTTVEPTTEEEE